VSKQSINKSRVNINSAADVFFVVEDNRYSAFSDRKENI